ncbi:putative serine/threonine-protein kinase Cx32 [Hibiscus syriacus]|uniref:non-specific serine/threonine protein kinase n=1 Tax=Hibiscus syriacus TaxID=106335 RepID=A0A6A3BTX5_HIBSY|nr:probable serine/threonine-protein kinase PIX13 [Hibiscus syriacus]KAE8720094.1 putative serine/threonine-protein kinase Cx32 [Hibiscus syriacus]
MGNCWGSDSIGQEASHVYSSTNIPTTGGTSNNMASSATSSVSNCRSQFSQTVSEIVEEENPDGRILETPNLKVFTFAEMKTATKNFNTLLGEGGFGKVYKGWLDEKTLAPSKAGSGMIVAIKKLKQESVQGFHEWQSEVNFLGRLSHPSLVKLLGYCWEDTELLLVYEFMQKGSLENHLFRRNPAIEPMSWETRLKIVIGAARGLAFLHFSEKVIYRDFKASNILLDGNFNAKISDFGLAKLGPSGGDSHVTTRVMGTYGYAAPEYIASGHLYVKSDVYGFGVLLEVMTGLRAFDTKRPEGKQTLVDWLKPTLAHKRKHKTIMDARIEVQYSSKAASLTAVLTLKCLEHDPKNRPSMKEVVEALERIESLNKERPKDTSRSGSIHSWTTPRHGEQGSSHRSAGSIRGKR